MLLQSTHVLYHPREDGLKRSLDRVYEVDEVVADLEALREQLAEAADAECLGRVVARGEEVDGLLGGLRS